MRRAPGKKQQERLARLRMAAEIIAGLMRLGHGVITGPFPFVRGIGIVKGVGVVVRAFERLPVVEALTAFARDKVGTPVTVQMPFADVARVIASGLQNLGEGRRIGMERDVIEKDTVRQWPLSGQQRRPGGRADRQASDGVDETDALRREAVEVGGFDVRITRESERLRAPLVGQDDQDVRLAFGLAVTARISNRMLKARMGINGAAAPSACLALYPSASATRPHAPTFRHRRAPDQERKE